MPLTELTPTDPTAFPIHKQQSTSSSNNLVQANLFNTSNAMIRHSSLEANSHPGLSFFCKNDTTLKYPQQPQEPQTTTFEKQTTPLVISRLNISHRKPAKNGFTDLDDETPPASPPIQPTIKHTGFFNFASAFKPGFGSVGMLRGKQKLDEARVNRKIEDLEIEKSSLLTLNQTLESVVKQQSNTIQDLQTKLAAIEGPLTPGLDKTLNIKGVMSTSSVESADNNEIVDDEDAAYERIRNMLLQLIEQAQSAVSEQQQHQIRVASTHHQQGVSSLKVKGVKLKKNYGI
ncbi:hypothetical protein K501DRAFT_284024 [Backusella circina FSU 941]|nr:hypothetical protein K501DRAFT_284024 [Backusella circina FSU 941]